MKKAIKAAFPATIPVMLGYLSVGVAFGLLFEKSGYNFMWAIFMSIAVYAGSMQFIAISLLTSGAGLMEIALVTLFVNIRHFFYGLSFIDKFKGMGKKKTYMIYSLSDETYSLLCSSKAPEGVDNNSFLFCIALLNQIYWIVGTFIGSIAGSLITFNTNGIDFAMTALFVVIFIEQWSTYKTHIPVLIGIASTILSLLIFGVDNLILPSMVLITVALMIFEKQIDRKTSEDNSGEVVNSEC
ncbi:AzlC family ABC transporter permease [Alkaliphilus sp. B6464]|uniref:AzlC family ABC transporter permease n=1 Tax=Alkaliphilus sp. B6464 TaxID=2731219 RepID=UPI001BA624EB|nr:AzlC family ABC transporter permease [Alkaliphilus sp. B6464]QUH19566.1 AzlC family ABC transporter permease [Alkaliphilus sp. B6464]